MSRTSAPGRRRRTRWAANAFLALAALALVGAAARPTVRRLLFEQRVQNAIRAVDSIRSSALRFHRDNGRWPARGTFVRANDRLGWHLWDAPGRPVRAVSGGAGAGAPSAARPAVDTLAGITLESREKPLLAALLEHYGRALSFARDSSWTLMIRTPGATRPRPDSVSARAP